MRQTRDRLSAEIADKSYEDLVRWLRSHRYADPALQRLAEEAAQQSAAQPTPAKSAGAAERPRMRNLQIPTELAVQIAVSFARLRAPFD